MSVPNITAHLEIRDFDCDPSAITASLGVQPSQVWKKGDSIALGKGERRYSGWRLTVPPLEEIELEPYVKWLLEKIPRQLDFSRVTAAWEAQISFTVHVDDETPAIFFSPATLTRVGELGANLDIDLYVGSA